MDTFDFYNYAGRHGHQYDTIVIDPPSFARNKKTFSVQKDYNLLIEGAPHFIARRYITIMYEFKCIFS